MARRLMLAVAGAAIAATAAPRVEAAAAPTAPAATANQADGLDYFVGGWVAEARDPGTGETVVVDYRVERAAGGAWLAGTAAARDGSLTSRDMWGRDPRTGELIRVIFDGSGAHATVRSPGWGGDTLVLEGDVQSKGGSVRVRETITRLGPDRFRAVWEARRDGRWAAYSIETVVRQARTGA